MQHAKLCPDLALLCEPERCDAGKQLLSKLGIAGNAPVFGVIPNSRCVEHGVTPLSDTTQYFRLLRTAVAWAVKKDFQVVGISHMIGTDRDVKLLGDLNIPIFHSNSATEVRSVVANLSAAACSRYHGLVNCIVHGVPAVALGWHPKYRGIMDLFDAVEFDHPLDDCDIALEERLNSIFEQRDELVEKSKGKLDKAHDTIRKSMNSMSISVGGPEVVLAGRVPVADVVKRPPSILQKLRRKLSGYLK